jgi:hypothetical protein
VGVEVDRQYFEMAATRVRENEPRLLRPDSIRVHGLDSP